uniref:Integral membrane protein n=1 Tax=Babesia bovis TaxID=5865 RepID=S6BNH3_BABBO|nr:integral membrane protein [Babesia bovis]
MLWGCWGFVFFFYPGISPFSILRFCDCQALMYICMCIETCIGLSMYALREYGGIGNKWESNKLGPINLKEGMGNILNNDILKNNSIFSSHVWRSPNFLLWCCFYAGYITVATIFILTMHYPDGVIAKIFFQRKFFIYPMTMFLVFTGNISMNLCWNAVWGNMIGEKGSHNGDRGLVMTILGLGYLRSFRAGKAAVESGLPYPTDKMGFVSSFFYWVQRGVVGGSKVFVGVFTTDVRTKVMV